MSREDAQNFIKEIITNESLRSQLNDRLDRESTEESNLMDRMGDLVPELASEHGYNFIADEGFDALETIQDDIQSEELSDAELEQVAGGASKKDKAEGSIISFGIGCAIHSIMDAVEKEECMGDL